MAVKPHYSKEELIEFEALLNNKLESAKKEFETYVDAVSKRKTEDIPLTGGSYNSLEDGSETLEKENMQRLAVRQSKYIKNLQNALIRIKNGTYGICSVSGKLIKKERLLAVPHTTMSIDAKRMQ